LWQGEPVYAPPHAEFIAYLYPPLSYVPMALSTALFGPSLFAARLPSLIACALTLWLIGRVCARNGAGVAAGVAGAGFFALGYGYAGAFLDLARVDALFVLLCAAAAERLDANKPRTALGLLCAACFAKQHGGIFLLAASLWLLARDARAHRVAIALTWIAAAAVFGGLVLASDGWFATYVLALPAGHETELHLLGTFVLVDLLVYLPALTVAAGVALWRSGKQLRAIDALLIAGVVAGALGRAHPGGEDNIRLPALLMLVMVGVPALTRALMQAERKRTRVLAGAALALQAAILWQPPSAHAPSAASAASFERLRDAMQRCAKGGNSVALDHALLTGTPFVHTMALWDVEQGNDQALAKRATRALVDALGAGDAPAAIALGQRSPALSRVLQTHYRECTRVPAPRLATGHNPGLRIDGQLMQIIYQRLPR
jgi:hypothetical protein